MKLLMHTCCAPCSVYCIESLRQENIEPTLFWYNPNIHPYSEYVLRRDCLKEYSLKIGVNLILEDEYGIEKFCKNVSSDLDARCTNYCYPVRLRKTFEYAKEHGYDAVTTTLLYSVYQNHEYIKLLCEKLSEEFGIEFLYRDFRVGFWIGHDKSVEEGLYMQKYCGCVFSENKSNPNNNKKPVLPEGFEFLQDRKGFEYQKIKENKRDYLELLLESDPSKKMIDQYLEEGELYTLNYAGETVCVAVITKVDNDTVELKNIATLENKRGKGYASKMIKYLSGNYKQKYKKMIVGTTENNIPFYVKHGFDTYLKTVKNFFVENYKEDLWDGDLKCIDMYYYSKVLK